MKSGSMPSHLDRTDTLSDRLRTFRFDETEFDGAPPELQGPYINAPVWPWLAAGLILGGLFLLVFALAWLYGRAA